LNGFQPHYKRQTQARSSTHNSVLKHGRMNTSEKPDVILQCNNQQEDHTNTLWCTGKRILSQKGESFRQAMNTNPVVWKQKKHSRTHSRCTQPTRREAGLGIQQCCAVNPLSRAATHTFMSCPASASSSDKTDAKDCRQVVTVLAAGQRG
jgi:hypothetical protein